MGQVRERLPEYPGDIGAGARGKAVEHLQEWLCLNDRALSVDGYFGPVTVAALKSFQREMDLKPKAALDQKTWKSLVEPMEETLTPLSSEEKGDGRLPTLALAYA
ncbi:hypothetical protein GF324_11770, partial [bacterium]|nr:hypothetical protein [bacterium]